MSKIYNYKAISSELKEIDRSKRTVAGYFSAFNVVDSMGDVVLPGAFTKTLREQGPWAKQPRIKHLLNHDVSQPLGKLIDLKEDTYGLFYVSEIGSHSLGNDFLEMVDSGLVTEHSIGYQVVKQNQVGDWKTAAKGEPLWELVELKLYEGSSLTGWGVNQFTPMVATIKADADKIAERIKRLEKFCRNATATDETIELLLLEIKQLSQLLADSNTTQAVEETLEPEPEAVNATPKEDGTAIALAMLDFQHTIKSQLNRI